VTADLIHYANVELTDESDAICASMIRFRGPSMDVGTAFEIGYMAAQESLRLLTMMPFYAMYGSFETPGVYKAEHAHTYE
jgi:nucleoside 2-deoxyribosyltransferase